MLLDWRGRRDGDPDLVEAAELIRAVDAVLDDPATRTRDIGGTLGTAAFAEAVRTILATDVTTRSRRRQHTPTGVTTVRS